MAIIIWLIVGGICGWLASLIMRTDAQQGIILNVVVGIVGAVIAGLLFGVNMNAGITIESFLYALIGAIILLAIVNLIRRGTVRYEATDFCITKAARDDRAAFYFHCNSNVMLRLTCSFCSPGSILVEACAISARAYIGTGGGTG